MEISGGHTSEVDHMLDAMLGDLPPAVQRRMLFIGMGTGKMITKLKLQHNVLVDVIEYDPNVVRAAELGFDFTVTEGEQLLVADAGEAIHSVNGPYFAIAIDCMVSGIIPLSCRSDAFLSRLAAIVSPGGVVAQFVWSEQRDALQDELMSSFAHVHFLPVVPIPTNVNVADTHGDGGECARWAADGECDSNPDFMRKSCAAACHLTLATSSAASPLHAGHNGWVVATAAERMARLVCRESLAKCEM